jgi:hypothetical protein
MKREEWEQWEEGRLHTKAQSSQRGRKDEEIIILNPSYFVSFVFFVSFV